MQTDKVTPEFKDHLFQLVETANSILITSHTTPDDDSIGSVLSTYYIFSEKYPDKKINIIYSKDINRRWSYFTNFSKIQTTPDIASIVGSYDLVIYLDGCVYSRFSKDPDNLKINTKKSICIDHHSSEPDQFDLMLRDTNASSVTELIYLLLVQDFKKIPTSLAEILLLGILGDTGNLVFIKPSQTYVFSIVQRLVEDGDINIQELKSHYMNYPYKVFTIAQEIIKNSQIKEIAGWPKFMTSYLTKEFIINGGYTDIEVSSASHICIQTFGNSIEETTWVIYAIPKLDGRISFSLRSRPQSISVKSLMQNMKIGGGHDRAAGGDITPQEGEVLDSQACLEKVFAWMEKKQPVLV